jgi:hypothetical protein
MDLGPTPKHANDREIKLEDYGFRSLAPTGKVWSGIICAIRTEPLPYRTDLGLYGTMPIAATASEVEAFTNTDSKTFTSAKKPRNVTV